MHTLYSYIDLVSMNKTLTTLCLFVCTAGDCLETVALIQGQSFLIENEIFTNIKIGTENYHQGTYNYPQLNNSNSGLKAKIQRFFFLFLLLSF